MRPGVFLSDVNVVKIAEQSKVDVELVKAVRDCGYKYFTKGQSARISLSLGKERLWFWKIQKQWRQRLILMETKTESMLRYITALA